MESINGQVESLLTQWRVCVEELMQLQSASATGGRTPIRNIHQLIRQQQNGLDRLVEKRNKLLASEGLSLAQQDEMMATLLSSAKSCSWQSRWDVIKRFKGLIHVSKEFPRSPRFPVPTSQGWLAYKDQPFQEKPVLVDAVIDSGATWLKFVSTSAKALEYQIATDGWDSEDDDDLDVGGGALANTEFAVALDKLILAAKWNNCCNIHIVLTHISEGLSSSIDRMLAYTRKRGGAYISMTISCTDCEILTAQAPQLEVAISNLVARDGLVKEDCHVISSTVNLDPSVLIALASDMSHGPVQIQPESQGRIIEATLLAQKESKDGVGESREDVLAGLLYPALRSKKLVCTRAAADYFFKVVAAIATHSEEVRASLILSGRAVSGGGSAPKSGSEIRRELQQWCRVPIPEDFVLPIQIVDDIKDVEFLVQQGRLPKMASSIAHDLSRLNQSVYFYGWANRMTTISGHRGVERQIELSIATHWKPEDHYRPQVWHRHICGYLIHRDKPKNWRSLVGTEGIPPELVRWTNPWTTWGRGISTYGIPDTKTWDGVGHPDKQSFGRMRKKKARDTAVEVSEQALGGVDTV